MLFFKSKIDQLEEKQNKLIQKREDLKSKTAFKNSKIEAKITKLQEKAFANREYLDKFVTNTELKLAKNPKLILAEADYGSALGRKYRKGGKNGN